MHFGSFWVVFLTNSVTKIGNKNQMKRRTTFNLRFWIYKSRAKSGNVPLYARITVNGQRAEAGIKRSAPVNLWDAENGKMRGNCEESREINSYLSLIQGSVFEAYQGLIIEKVNYCQSHPGSLPGHWRKPRQQDAPGDHRLPQWKKPWCIGMGNP